MSPVLARSVDTSPGAFRSSNRTRARTTSSSASRCVAPSPTWTSRRPPSPYTGRYVTRPVTSASLRPVPEPVGFRACLNTPTAHVPRLSA